LIFEILRGHLPTKLEEPGSADGAWAERHMPAVVSCPTDRPRNPQCRPQ